jgi:hypothetical protein
MSNSSEYQKGYRAGQNKILKQRKIEQKERIYMQCLELSIKHCHNWSFGKKSINNSERYCRLAGIFAENSISEINDLE